MTPDEYCVKVCGGRCCTLHVDHHRVRCPHQADDNSCTIYTRRFSPGAPEKEVVGLYVLPSEGEKCPTVGQFWCWRIESILAHNLLPEEVRVQCCYAHPELLEETNHGIETCNP